MMTLKIRAESDHRTLPACELVAMLDEVNEMLCRMLDTGELAPPFTETYYASSGEISVAIELEPTLVKAHPGAMAYED